jgi:uncharacterized RDD family membrane protein YckC
MMQSAGHVRRFIAYLIDWYLSALIFSMAISLFASIHNGVLTVEGTISNLPFFLACLALVVGTILVIGYFVLPQKLSNKFQGQTIGKHLLKIKVVGKDGQAVSSGTLIIRTLLGILIIEQTFYNPSYALRSVLGMILSIDIITYAYYFFLCISFISILYMLFNKEHKMIHDFISNTKVVNC